MPEALAARFSAVTEEERRLIAGEPLDMAAYTADASGTFRGNRLLPREMMITLRPHTRFTAFPPHSHDYVEAMYVLRGCVTHALADGETVAVKAGELIFINRRATHAIARCGENDIAVNFIVQPAFFDFALEMVGAGNELGRFLLDALRSGESAVPCLYFQISGLESVQRLLESMLWGFLEGGAGRRIQRVEMGLLFLHLLKHSDRMRISAAARHWSNLAVELLSDIRTHYADFSLKRFAEARGLSVSYVSRVAREATGQRCTELLQQRRLEKAEQLLSDTDDPVLSICEQVGYSNSSHFYRLFEARAGQSPTAYRGSHRTR